MGSSARHSTGRKAGTRPARKGKRKTTRRKPGQSHPDVHAILGRVSDAMSMIATATNAMVHAQHIPGGLKAQDVSDELLTLEHGVRALRAAYEEMDRALLAVLP